ncbi:TRAP transporter large permease [Devosia sp. 63-57]|uniref:TRAP transporter large permease n=1 Tax=Devosia sp. 63-57 TaxID=1895751 RepID=UPI00086CA715|nr:TRAP transporter large permease [Devosia sp. 63-57]ODT50820.1 MAG: C4-dicarboxylate ABC transporter permease [Pelagibacterium sp. SCN 63-126]ODU82435.1 MAG: C4-dicarboxylate ABC transporter permease [Pelagibacterium sp. SCN 63-17]OJX44518.1 MAG: C4-dicarboxylate ABC transporter permease [Devosia sp. 63-57]
MEYWVLFGVFGLLMVVGTPIAFCLGIASFATIVYIGRPPVVVFQQLNSGVGAFTLLAIPFFIFAGDLMMRGGIAARIIAFAGSIIGHVRGGLGQVNVLASTLFGGISGSAVAEAAAVGGIMIPQMKARGYGADYAVNVTSMSALIALLLPPSHNMIIYSLSGGGRISIADLFTAGVIPGLLLAVALMITAYVVARKRGYPTEPFPGFARAFQYFLVSIPGLLLIVIIFGGVRSGIFTATESSCIAVIYAFLVTLLVYRSMSWSNFVHCVTGAVRTTAMVLFIIGAAASFGWLMAYLRVAPILTEFVGQLTSDPLMVLLLINVLLLLLGTFMDMGPLIIITTPIFLPMVTAFGVDPVHFGVIMILNLGIGLNTPPLGPVQFVAAAVGKISIWTAMKSVWPFYGAGLVVLAMVTYIPALSLWLPSLFR